MEMMRSEAGTGGSVKKKTQGRRKIEIKKIEKKSSRQVTFSKRRGGLFKKASEVCILTGAQVAIIVCSQGKRLFSFGHPDADAVIDRYLCWAADNPTPSTAEKKRTADQGFMSTAEKKRSDQAGLMWWDDDSSLIEGKQVEELEQYLAALDELRNKVTQRADDLMVLPTTNSAAPMEDAPPLLSSFDDHIDTSIFYYDFFDSSHNIISY